METIPEQIQDIVLGSKLVTNHVVARWLTETTSSFVFDPTSMSVVEYCRNPTSFCVHLPSLLFASNKALLASGFCKLDFTGLNLDEIPAYSSCNDSIKKKATSDLGSAINDAADFTVQLLRLFLTRGPFQQTQIGIIPFVDTIVARYGKEAPLFTEALPGLLADLNNVDKSRARLSTRRAIRSPRRTVSTVFHKLSLRCRHSQDYIDKDLKNFCVSLHR